MKKHEIQLTQVYRINGRLVVANSIEGAINTWREWMSPNAPEITNIERMSNDQYNCIGHEALVYAEGLCGDVMTQFVEDITKLNEEKAKLQYDLNKRDAYCLELEKQIQELKKKAGK